MYRLSSTKIITITTTTTIVNVEERSTNVAKDALMRMS